MYFVFGFNICIIAPGSRPMGVRSAAGDLSRASVYFNVSINIYLLSCWFVGSYGLVGANGVCLAHEMHICVNYLRYCLFSNSRYVACRCIGKLGSTLLGVG